MSLQFDCAQAGGRERALARALTAIHDGELVVVPTESGYGLACDAFSRIAVEELVFTRGSSPEQSPPVMIGHVRTLDGIARDVSADARTLATAFWPGPLTLVLRSQPTLAWDLGGDQTIVSVRVPLHPVLLALLDLAGPLVVTAANVVGHPVPVTCQEARNQLGEAVGVYLDAGPAVRTGTSTIVDARGLQPGERPRVIRPGLITQEQISSALGEPLAVPLDEPSLGE